MYSLFGQKGRAVFLVGLILLQQFGLCLKVNALNAVIKDRSAINAKVGLFAEIGSGEYYTLYPNGINKKDAKVGGFKSVQIDPLNENVLFYDPVLKVIAQINIENGTIKKLLGKPRSSEVNQDYSKEIDFGKVSLVGLKDFTVDQYGNIYILLEQNNLQDQSIVVDKVLKASIKTKKVAEVFDEYNRLHPKIRMKHSYTIDTNLQGINVDNEDNLYLYGNCDYKRDGYQYYAYDNSNPSKGNSPIVLKLNTLTNALSFYAAKKGLKDIGLDTNLDLGEDYLGSTTKQSLIGLHVDGSRNIFTAIKDWGMISPSQSGWFNTVSKVASNAEGELVLEKVVGSERATLSDLGDGGAAVSAYISSEGSRFVCKDEKGDLFFTDKGSNKVRKVLNESGLITTVVGGGSEQVTFDNLKSPYDIQLDQPESIFVDKSNKLFIAEKNRILFVKDLLISEEQSAPKVKVASLEIAKIAGQEVVNPSGEVSLPDLMLEYSLAGSRNVEVKAKNIPDGTEVKVVSGVEGSNNTSLPSKGNLSGGIAVIPINIQAGATEVIKAETAPFIPAPGVYLPENAPEVSPGTLPPEPDVPMTNRAAVNLYVEDSENKKLGNLIPSGSRFNFTKAIGWGLHSYNYPPYELSVNPSAALDPDSIGNDANKVEFNEYINTIYQQINDSTGKTTFSIWMRTDSGNITVPIAVGPACPNLAYTHQYHLAGWEGCKNVEKIAQGSANTVNVSLNNVQVTPQWQKFTVDSLDAINTLNKIIFIGGAQNINQTFYLWGARLEKIN